MPQHKDPRDFLNQFHVHAQKHGKQTEEQKLIDHNEQIKQKVISILDKVKKNKPQLEQLKQTNPEAYQSMMHMVQAMMSMAKEYVVPAKPAVPQREEQAPQMEQGESMKKFQAGTSTRGFRTSAKSGAGRVGKVRGIPSPQAGSTHQGGADSRHHTKEDIAVLEPASGERKGHKRQMEAGAGRSTIDGSKISARKIAEEIHRGQSNPGPVGPVTH